VKGGKDMAASSVLWTVCGVIWGVLILAFVGITIFNRRRNRKQMEDGKK
jgi:diacylglycerol kinase